MIIDVKTRYLTCLVGILLCIGVYADLIYGGFPRKGNMYEARINIGLIQHIINGHQYAFLMNDHLSNQDFVTIQI